MSVLSKAPLPSGDDVRRVALAALSAALENGTQQEEKKPAKRSGPMKGVRTVATGAALFVAGRAATKGGHAILDQRDGGRQEDGDEDDDDVDDEEEEPSAEEDEDFDNEES